MNHGDDAEIAMAEAVARHRPRSRWGRLADGIVGLVAVTVTGYLIATVAASWW